MSLSVIPVLLVVPFVDHYLVVYLCFFIILVRYYCAYQYAYRFTEVKPDGSTILKHDNDDDGEDAAGSKLAHLLEMRKEEGVLVVVTRWYGGIQLGPKRFHHIINLARELLVQSHEQTLIRSHQTHNRR